MVRLPALAMTLPPCLAGRLRRASLFQSQIHEGLRHLSSCPPVNSVISPATQGMIPQVDKIMPKQIDT